MTGMVAHRLIERSLVQHRKRLGSKIRIFAVRCQGGVQLRQLPGHHLAGLTLHQHDDVDVAGGRAVVAFGQHRHAVGRRPMLLPLLPRKAQVAQAGDGAGGSRSQP